MTQEAYAMKWIYASLLALLVSGPAGAGLFGPSEKDFASLHRVAVVSLLGDTFYSVLVGTLVIQNTTHDFPVPQWDINGFARDEAVRLLSEKGRFKGEPLALEGLDERTLYRKPDDYAISAAGVEKLVALARQQGFDGVLVLDRYLWRDFQFYTPGFGVMRRTMFGQSGGCVYVSMLLNVYRVDSGQSVVARPPPPCKGLNLDFEPRATLEAYSAEEQLALAAAVKAQVNKGLESTLTDMKLLNPSAGQTSERH
jgi:hypothetical protein